MKKSERSVILALGSVTVVRRVTNVQSMVQIQKKTPQQSISRQYGSHASGAFLSVQRLPSFELHVCQQMNISEVNPCSIEKPVVQENSEA